MKNEEIKLIELELTTLCNADCPLCYRNYKSFNAHYPKTLVRPLEDIIIQLEQYPNLFEIRLVGSISEPTLYNQFFALVKYIKSRNIQIEICTNGDTHNTKWWCELGKLMDVTDGVFFSICGSTQELHNIYRKNTSLQNILDNASAFRENGLNIDHAQCIRFEYNDNDFNTPEFKNVVSEFSNIYWTETFLLKDESNYVKTDELHKLKPLLEKQKN